jgi:hypothetical protein
MVQHYTDSRPIDFADMAAAIREVIWYVKNHLHYPTTVNLFTGCSVVYATLSKGTGLTLRSSANLQTIYCTKLILLIKAGHALVVRWIPSG